MKFWENLPHSFFEILISKFKKSELGKFIPNFPLKHVITSTNFPLYKYFFENTWSMNEQFNFFYQYMLLLAKVKQFLNLLTIKKKELLLF